MLGKTLYGFDPDTWKYKIAPGRKERRIQEGSDDDE